MSTNLLPAEFLASVSVEDDLIVLHAELSAMIMEGAGVGREEADFQAAQQLGFESLTALHRACHTVWCREITRAKPLNKKAELFVDYADKFLKSTWVDEALALGWGALDLFGVDPEQPFVRLDRQGLLPGIAFSSSKLTLDLMSADCAVFTCPSGSRLRHWREIGDHRCVLAWHSRALFLA
jgi:hypothetical protein